MFDDDTVVFQCDNIVIKNYLIKNSNYHDYSHPMKNHARHIWVKHIFKLLIRDSLKNFNY